MKTNAILFVVIFCLSATISSHAQLLVGKVEGGQAKLTADSQKLLSSFNRSMRRLSVTSQTFTSVTLVNSTSAGYLLVFKGGNVKSTFLAEQRDGNLLVPPVVTCTTTDCSSEELGCIPSETACTACANKGTCTKTVSDSALFEI